jgi:hypothetical protein
VLISLVANPWTNNALTFSSIRERFGSFAASTGMWDRKSFEYDAPGREGEVIILVCKVVAKKEILFRFASQNPKHT